MARVLVIDDDDQFRKTLSTLLSKAGHEVSEAPNGNLGLNFLSNHPCDLIITDIFMPEKEGIETITDVKKNYPEIKIIAISGGSSFSTKDFLTVAKKLGADAILQKPFGRNTILEVLSKLLSS